MLLWFASFMYSLFRAMRHAFKRKPNLFGFAVRPSALTKFFFKGSKAVV